MNGIVYKELCYVTHVYFTLTHTYIHIHIYIYIYQVVKKIVKVIKEEIQKVKERIAAKRLQKAERKAARARQEAAARQKGRPLPAIPNLEVEEKEDDGELKRDMAKLNKLEEKEAENNEIYFKLGAVDDMLDELVVKTGRLYYMCVNDNIAHANGTVL